MSGILLQAGERNFLSSYSRNLGFVDLPIPVLGTPLWFARGCENAAGKLSRGGKQQQGPISPNHLQALKGAL